MPEGLSGNIKTQLVVVVVVVVVVILVVYFINNLKQTNYFYNEYRNLHALS